MNGCARWPDPIDCDIHVILLEYPIERNRKNNNMNHHDYLIDSEDLPWHLAWQENYEQEYDRSIRRLLVRMIVVVAMLPGLHWAGASGYEVFGLLAIATFLCCCSSVQMFFDDFFCSGLFREETRHLTSFSLAMVLAAVVPVMLW